MRTYELMVIHRPELAEPDVRSMVDELQQALSTRGAEIAETDFWGKRRLAYEINHINEGYYSVMKFDAESDVVEVMDRALSIADTVVRHKFIRPGPQ